MPFRLSALALAGAFGLAAAAQAAPVVSSIFASDAAVTAFLTGAPPGGLGIAIPADEIAVAEGRFGNNSPTGTPEAGLHTPPNFTAEPPIGTPGNFAWGSINQPNDARPFTLTRNASGLRFQLGNYDQTDTRAAVQAIDVLQIRFRATNSSGIFLTNLVLDDASPGTLAIADLTRVNADGASSLVISGIMGDFTLTGSARLSWAATPGGSGLAFQLKMYDAPPPPETGVPTPAGFGLFGLALAALAAVRRRA